jgi:predicted nucleotidyltransferase
MRQQNDQMDASELRRNLFEVLRRVEGNRHAIEIRRNGRIVAVLSPPTKKQRSQKPKIDRRRLARICKRHHIQRLALFGSILRDDFGPESDVDVLVDPQQGCLTTLKEYSAVVASLTDLFGHPVDLLKRSVIEASPNAKRKQEILGSAQVIYEAR